MFALAVLVKISFGFSPEIFTHCCMHEKSQHCKTAQSTLGMLFSERIDLRVFKCSNRSFEGMLKSSSEEWASEASWFRARVLARLRFGMMGCDRRYGSGKKRDEPKEPETGGRTVCRSDIYFSQFLWSMVLIGQIEGREPPKGVTHVTFRYP
jgi:hypothetical protein